METKPEEPKKTLRNRIDLVIDSAEVINAFAELAELRKQVDSLSKRQESLTAELEKVTKVKADCVARSIELENNCRCRMRDAMI